MKASQLMKIVLGCILYFVLLILVSSVVVVYSPTLHEPFLGDVSHAKNLDVQVTSYLQSGDESLLLPLTENEASHIIDVRDLMNAGWLLLICFAVVFAILLSSTKHRVAIFSFPLVVAIYSLPTLLFFNKNFTYLFELFHKIFFPQGNYLFALDSLLISMYPESFFLSLVLLIGGMALVLSIVFFAFVLRNKRKIKKAVASLQQ